ncbi:MAG TPA: acyl-CoA dehydrogenase family protein [Burkholderiales bacterium]
MDLSLSEEQRMMVDAARRLVDKHIQPILDAHDRDRALPKAAILKIMGKAAELGLTSARIPEAGGGAGLSMLDYGLITEQMPASVVLILQPHEATTARVYFGCNEQQKARYLADLVAGRSIACTASTEPDVGSDPRAVKTTLTADGEHLILKGRKQWISNSTVCDVMNVTCRRVNPDGTSSFARVIVDRAESPFETREVLMHGLRQAPLGEVLFDRCRVPRGNLCPDTGDTARLLTLTWLANRPLVGLVAVGLGQKALAAAREYAGVRKQFGRVIGGFQLVQNDLAEIETAVVTSRLLCYHALAALDRGERANGLSAMAKRYAVDACDRAVALAMRIHGAMGLSRELGLEQLARDVRTLSIPDGTPGILTLIQGRELTGIDPFR